MAVRQAAATSLKGISPRPHTHPYQEDTGTISLAAVSYWPWSSPNLPAE